MNSHKPTGAHGSANQIVTIFGPKGVQAMSRISLTRGNSTKLSRLVAGATVIAALTLSGCSDGAPANAPDFSTGGPIASDSRTWEGVVEAAKAEGEVVLYGPALPMDDVVAAFEADNPGITVRREIIPTPELISRVDQEIAVGAAGADVVLHSSESWFKQNDEASKLLSLHVSPESAAHGWIDMLGGQSFASVYGFPYTLGYTTTGPGEVESIEELLTKYPDARIGLVSPTAAPAIANYYEVLRQTYGDSILDRLAKTENTIVENNVPGMRSLIAGEFDYLIPSVYFDFVKPMAQGAPVASKAPASGASGPRYSTASPSSAPHPAAAQVFMNWMMGEQGAKQFVKVLPPATVPLDTAGAIPWGEVATMNPDDWTKDKWDAWIKDQWTPRFG